MTFKLVTFGVSLPGEYDLDADIQNDHYAMRLTLHHDCSNRIIEEFLDLHKDDIKLPGYRAGHAPADLLKHKLSSTPDAYNQCFSEFANIILLNECPMQVLLTDHFAVRRVEDQYVISFDAWVDPVIDFPPLDDLALTVPYVDEFVFIDNFVHDRFESFRLSNPILQHKVNIDGQCLAACPGDMLEVRIGCKIDGKLYKPGCEDSARIRLLENTIVPRELYDELLGAPPGRVAIINTSTSNVSHLRALGSKLRLVIKVLRVFRCEDAIVDDDLAITAGFNSLAEWKTSLIEQARRHLLANLAAQKRQAILDHFLPYLANFILPQPLLDNKSREMPHYNMKQIEDMIKHTILLRAVGKTLGLDMDPSDMSYLNEVLNQILAKVRFEHVDR